MRQFVIAVQSPLESCEIFMTRFVKFSRKYGEIIEMDVERCIFSVLPVLLRVGCPSNFKGFKLARDEPPEDSQGASNEDTE